MRNHDIDARSRRLFGLSIGVFFIGGFVASILSLLVPRIRDVLSLGYGAATSVQLATHSSYLALAVPIAAAIAACGYMRGHAIGLLLMAIGLVGVVGGFASTSFAAVFAALCLVSTGATFLQMRAIQPLRWSAIRRGRRSG